MAECFGCEQDIPLRGDVHVRILSYRNYRDEDRFFCTRGPIERELRAFLWGHGLDGLSAAAADLYQGAHAGMLRRGLVGMSVNEIASEAIEFASEAGL